jgi:hypothetical protein
VTETCVWCGGGPMTLEHLWADWVAGVLHSKAKKPKKGRRKTPVTPHESRSDLSSEFTREWRMSSLQQTVRISCKACNNGWIESFDRTGRPVLTPLLRAERRTTLDADEQRIIARWIAKTAMIIVQLSDRRPIPRSQHYYLRTHRRPPPSTQVWIGARTAEEGVWLGHVPSVLLRQHEEAEEESRAYLVTFGVGHLVCSFFGHDLGFEIPWTNRIGLEQVWPVVEPTIEWPPKCVFGSLEHLANDPSFEQHVEAGLAARGITLERVEFSRDRRGIGRGS